MKNRPLSTALFSAALLVAASGFAQTAASPQKGDEDPTSRSSNSSANSTASSARDSAAATPASTDTASTETTSGKTKADNSATGSSSTTRGAVAGSTAPRTYTGTVKTLNAGRTIALTTAGGKVQTFDLSNSPALADSVAVGSRVRIKQTVDTSGHTVVTVEPYR